MGGRLQVKEFQDFRRSLPETSKIIVCKNTLMAIAADKVAGFSPLKDALAVSPAPACSSNLTLLETGRLLDAPGQRRLRCTSR